MMWEKGMYRMAIYIDGIIKTRTEQLVTDYQKNIDNFKKNNEYFFNNFEGKKKVEIRVYLDDMFVCSYTAYRTDKGNVGWESKTELSQDGRSFSNWLDR